MFTDIRKLRTFVAIAEERSFTAAAERLNMAQPWVSVQLKQLEDMVDAVLVERSKGKLINLTASGQEFLPVAQRLLKACEEADREITVLRNRERSKLVLGVDAATLYMPERNVLIQRFLDRLPETELRIVSAPPSELFDGLNNGKLDLLLTLCPGPEQDDIEILPLYDYPLHFLVPRANAKEYAAPDYEGMKGATVMVLPESYHPAFFSWLKAAFEEFDINWKDCPEVSYQALIRYASMMGIATLSPDFSDSIPEMGGNMEVRAIESRPVAVSWALMRRHGGRGRAQERFWNMAVQSRQMPKINAA